MTTVKTSRHAHLALLVACAGFALSAYADVFEAAPVQPPAPGMLALRTGSVDTRQLPNQLAQAVFAPGVHVLTFDAPLDPARRAALEAAGVTDLGYLPAQAMMADLSKTTPAALNALGFVDSAVLYQDAWRTDPQLLQGARNRPFVTADRTNLAQAGRVAVIGWAFARVDAGLAAAQLAAIPGVAVAMQEQVRDQWVFSMDIPAASVPALASLGAFQFFEQTPEYTTRSNLTLRATVQSGTTSQTPLYARGLTGTGQVVAIIDAGLASGHCSFSDPVNPIGPLHRKILAYNSSQFYDQHGTHVAATAIGDAGSENNTRGVAYNAKVVFNTYPGRTDTSHIQRYGLHYSQGAAIHSNSWGDAFTQAYDGGCRGIDAFSHDNDDNLVLFAVTNSAGPVANPENAKNALAVSIGNLAPDAGNSCQIAGAGPTTDGRRKPEVTGPGCSISSASGTGCSTAILGGTSMATPAVGGIATLTRQYFMSGFYPSGAATPADAFVPSGPLVKAMVVNSATDMTGITGYPSAREGFGRVVADQSLYFQGDALGLVVRDVRNASDEALATGGTAEQRVFVRSCNPQPLKVTLVWHDEPAAVNAAFAPINNLDLTVLSPSGLVYRGNNFVGGLSIAGGVADPLNNNEQVLIPAPESGSWTVLVGGTAVNVGFQGYAVVITGAVDANACASADFNCDGDVGTDADIEAFFAALAGGPGEADFNRDGDVGTDADIESFFRVLAGGAC